MASHMVSYDLIKRKDYPDLHAALKSYSWWHCLGSTWIIKSDQSCAQIRDYLRTHIDADDRLLVTKLTGESAWTGSFPENCSQWLRDNL